MNREEIARIIDPEAWAPETVGSAWDSEAGRRRYEATAKADAILELSSLPLLEGWRPIETAPTDGTRVMLWHSRRQVAVSGCWHVEPTIDTPLAYEPGWAWWSADEDLVMWDSGPDDLPGAWMPLPSAPSLQGGGDSLVGSRAEARTPSPSLANEPASRQAEDAQPYKDALSNLVMLKAQDDIGCVPPPTKEQWSKAWGEAEELTRNEP